MKEIKQNENTCPFSFRISKEDKDLFQSQYPYCLSRFVKLCINKASKDRSFFNEIYFNL